ncbi:hypothetical protein ACN6KF_002443 [Labrys sp. La1]|uniref:hypothetical protein n=1 Tax=Labrys sp. La1 TaxID=3404917 RepID=UPI003EB86379
MRSDQLQQQQLQHIFPSGFLIPVPLVAIMGHFLFGAHDISRGALAFDDAAQAARSNARDRLPEKPMTQK